MSGKFAKIKPGDEVVISGIAGRFPESDDLAQLQENLFNKVDLITDENRRWKAGQPKFLQQTGKINHLEKFDSQFFGIPSDEADTIDPMGRMLMEHAYEAIIDAGINPRQLRGTNTGIFVGTCYMESELIRLYDPNLESGFGVTGCSRSMIANRISHWLGCTGPSYVVDTACSSSLSALNHAYEAIRSGQCDAALVGGCNVCRNSQMSLRFFLLGILSTDARCRSFDGDGDGYCRSEAICVIYLQKAKDAKRIYAEVVNSKTNCDGFKKEGITFPSSTMQSALLKQVYEECGVPPSSVAYVEAHGTGTKAGDPAEVISIEKVFCPGRTTPLRIGSVKSNLGHSEPASGICSVAKVIIAMESGYIPPNLHYNRPRAEIQSLVDGRIQVVTELTPWDGGYVGINSFGFGGGNAHVLLKWNQKQKVSNSAPTDNVPRLVVVSGRTKEAVTTLLDNLESRPVDVEFISLFHDIYAEEIQGHLYRGYTILPPLGVLEQPIRNVQPYSDAKRPVCFVFSGIGSQWTGIGDALLTIPAFAKAAQKCQATLMPYDLNVIDILTNKDPSIMRNLLTSFVGTTALQIGLVDLLACMQIVPDFTIGHSVGELGCAYANGCLTAEQTVLAAYFQGLALVEAELIPGSMAHIGLGNVELMDVCPADIDIACYDSSESTMISGPAESIKSFVARLQKNDIAATVEPTGNIACHSRYVATVRPKLLADLQKVIVYPKLRGPKWLSTSVPRHDWETSSAQLCSPEYHANNLLNPVLFEKTLRLIPNNAIIIEIASHSLLRTALKRSFDRNVINIALTEAGSVNNVEVLLRAIGKLYEAGLQPRLTKLYPEIQYPVSRGTPMISPLLRWDHSKDFVAFDPEVVQKNDSGEKIFNISLATNDFDWMAGHDIDGRNLLPATGYLALVWQTLAVMKGVSFSVVPVVFENVSFHRTILIPEQGMVQLTIMIQRGSGRFEVTEDSAIIVTGLIRAVSNPASERAGPAELVTDNEELRLTSRDVYKELRLRGYNYRGLFRGITRASLDGTGGFIIWDNNWVAFMENMLQMKILGIDSRELCVPKSIRKLVIDTAMHMTQLLAITNDEKVFAVKVYKDLDTIVSGGLEIRGFKTRTIARKRPAGDPVMENFKFVAHLDRSEVELDVVARIVTQIAIENMLGMTLKTMEFIGEANISPENLTSPLIAEILSNTPKVQADINIIAPADTFANDALPSGMRIFDLKKLASESKAHLVICHSLLANKNTNMLKLLKTAMPDGGFLLIQEPLNLNTDIVLKMKSQGFEVILEKCTNNELVTLFRRIGKPFEIASVIHVNNDEFTWLTALKASLKVESQEKNTNKRILIVGENFESGLLGLVNCLRREPGGEIIQGLLIQDSQAPKFSVENPFYSEQLKLGLAINVLRDGQFWGSYRFFRIPPLTFKSFYHARLIQDTRGDLSAMKWVEGIIQPDIPKKKIIKVHYSSINFFDVMLSTGKLTGEITTKTRQAQDRTIGIEFSGKDADGRAVMGMTPTGAFSNLCICDSDLLWVVPDDWTLEDAATVPVAYGTAYYALYLSGKMKEGDKVMIHAGSSCVGQAAIALALHTACEVFTTVETLDKREFIKTRFPQIDDDHIGNSTDTSFEQLILHKTQGQGVNIVLNSLAEDKLQASIRCLTIGGRLLEIEKYDYAANSSIGMEGFLKGISFHGIFLDQLLSASTETKIKLVAMLANGIESGVVKPLLRVVFPMDQTEAAFRYMAAGKHIGKIVVKLHNGDGAAQSQLPLALPRYHCSDESSYVILGGLGGIGLELVDWLVLRGAKKIVLTSRTGVSNGYQRMRFSVWKTYGVAVVIVAGQDASTYEGCEAILKEAITLGPVSAIFNLAVVLEDALFENQTEAKFEKSFRVKAWATKQLDKLSRILCPDLKHFVVFSSVTSGRGYAGQTNYGMSNSAMERICETRAAEGLPGLAIQWGAVGDVGILVKMQDDYKEVVINGTLQQKISSFLQQLDIFLTQNFTTVSSMVVAGKQANGDRVTNMVDVVINIIGLKNREAISIHTPLVELGVDSVMGAEIKQTLERQFDIFLTSSEIHDLNLAKLLELPQQLITDDNN